jgi:hypothetical protein
MLRLSFISVLCFGVLALFPSCRKPVTHSSSKNVKYEIVGQFTGSIQVTYHDNVSGSNVVNNASAPWSIELQYGSEVTEVGIEAIGYVTGNPGQTITFNIYINNTLVRTHTSVSDRSGKVTIPLQIQSL